MRKIVAGTRRFRTEVYPEMAGLFRDLSEGQEPRALFITCADSRVDPSLLTQSDPGTLFVIRNAGNVVPPNGTGGEGATIEYAIEVLGVRHVIVCGHYGCGAMHALLEPSKTTKLPLVRRWLEHSGEVTEAIIRKIETVGDRDLQRVAVEANVRLQLAHLKQHPAIAGSDARRKLLLHGWVWDIETGAVHGFDHNAGRWRELNG